MSTLNTFLFATAIGLALVSAALTCVFTVAALCRALVRLLRGLPTLFIITVLCAGCAHPIDGIIVALDASQATLVATHDVIEQRLAADRKAAVDAAPDKASAERAVAAVEAKYAHAWRDYHAARMAWIEAAALARAAQIADASGKSPAYAAAKRAADDADKQMAALGASMKEAK